MATYSDRVTFFCCVSCKDNKNIEEYALYYCDKCQQCFCGECCKQHDYLFSKHVKYDRENMRNWPVYKEWEAVLLMCEIHTNKQLEMFCKNHSQLCCSKCVSLSHSQCSQVTPISGLTNTQPTDLQGLLVELETVLGEIKRLQISHELSVQSLQRTYKEHTEFIEKQMLAYINTTTNIKTTIDECGNSCVSTSGKNEQYLKEEMCRSVLSILNEFDNITVKELNEMKDEVISIKGSVTSSIKKCTGFQKDLSQFHEFVQKIGDNKDLCLIASVKCKHILQQALNLLGKSGKAFNVLGYSEHNVKIPSDSGSCLITGCCVLPNGQVLVADSENYKVKLLNQQYQVVSHCDLADYPQCMCLLTPSKVAVAVNINACNTHEVQFITVTHSQLDPGRKLALQHQCLGISHHQGELFISSATALFKYSLSGKLVCRLYEDRSDVCTVGRCAVSPTGDKLYITSHSQRKLLTLAMDGTLLATFKDHKLRWPCSLHVTPVGQVLVCGGLSSTILQVDWEGRRKLATLATGRDGMWTPRSVCYSSTSSSIIVGTQGLIGDIMVFRVE